MVYKPGVEPNESKTSRKERKTPRNSICTKARRGRFQTNKKYKVHNEFLKGIWGRTMQRSDEVVDSTRNARNGICCTRMACVVTASAHKENDC
eukprot:819522-Amphidinium_carterae.1